MKQKDIDALKYLVEDNGLETIVEALKRISSESIHPALLAAAIRIATEDHDLDTDAEKTKQQKRIDWLVREISQERAKVVQAEAEVERLMQIAAAGTLKQAVDAGRKKWAEKAGTNCSMCAINDKPYQGWHWRKGERFRCGDAKQEKIER